jgi:hypothetical protein
MSRLTVTGDIITWGTVGALDVNNRRVAALSQCIIVRYYEVRDKSIELSVELLSGRDRRSLYIVLHPRTGPTWTGGALRATLVPHGPSRDLMTLLVLCVIQPR